MSKKNFKLFFDMDNTLALFNEPNALDRMTQEGFFRNLKPLPFLEEINNLAAMNPEDIYIISACINSPYCKKEKIEWLKEHLPFAQKQNVFFSKTGKSKPNFIKWKFKKIDKYDILIDDYSENLKEWEEAGGTAIKFNNGFNTKDPNIYKYIIKDFSELIQTLVKIRKEFESTNNYNTEA